jgi:hypothetical protein
MRIEIGLENNYENKSIAWALDYPGCFAYGAEGAAAIMAFPHAFIGYKERVESLAEENWIDFEDIDIHLAESFDCHPVDADQFPSAAGRNVTAFFQVDWNPLTLEEIDRGLEVMDWSRKDLVNLTRHLPAVQLDKERPGEKWSIRGILDHVATTELWLLDRLNILESESATLPEDIFRRLDATRNIYERSLRDLKDTAFVNGKDGTLWSPRKVLRRAAWHEVDHINHIFRLLNED